MGFIFKRKKKVSKDGTNVDIIGYRNDDNRTWEPVTESGKYLEEMTEYIDGIFPCKKEKPFVFHEILSAIVHIDVNIIPPDSGRDYYVLWTSGMSDLPMTLPDGDYDKKEYERAELVLFLPKDWKFAEIGESAKELGDAYYWPIRWLKYLARFPHEYKTWFGTGHTLPNSEDYDPLGEGTEMGGFFFLPVISLGKDYPGIDALICKDGTKINFLWTIPMYKEEIEYKLEEGFESMMDLFTKVGFPRVLDPKRQNCLSAACSCDKL
ncbi:MAG: suppressor of fused domain protein [Lachnospiraceae bacterium]|nr:suppressor of fused domain protein [Lachnospiraceae bacterium]